MSFHYTTIRRNSNIYSFIDERSCAVYSEDGKCCFINARSIDANGSDDFHRIIPRITTDFKSLASGEYVGDEIIWDEVSVLVQSRFNKWVENVL